MILNRYQRNPKMRDTLEKFLTQKQIELSQDDDRQVTLVEEDALAGVPSGSTIVMSVVTYEARVKGGVKCPFCRRRVCVARDGVQRMPW